MTIQGAIDRARLLRDTEISDKQMVEWLNAHDEQLYDRVLSKYGISRPDELPYTQYIDGVAEEDIDLEMDMMLPDKYGTGIYPLYLVMQIDLHHADYDRYNNDAIMLSQLEGEMKRDYSREGRWKPPRPEGWPDFLPYGRNDIRF